MKKLFLILTLLVLTVIVKAQYPITQNLGSSTTRVQVPANGALNANLINRPFTDTAAANLTNVKYYSGAQIYTTTDSILWMRNTLATRWLPIGGGSSGGSSSNTSITNIYNNSIVNINTYNDTCLVRCTGSGTCDTVCTNINITSWEAINCSTFVVCGYIPPDTLTQVCDTLVFGTCIPLYIFQNWTRQPALGVTEFGSNQRGFSPGLMLNHNTYTNTNYYKMYWDGYTVYDAIHEFTQQQSFQSGSAVTAFRHYGNPLITGQVNNVRMLINYTDSTYQSAPYIEGLIGGDRAYTFGTNFRGVAQNAYVDDNNSKTTLVEFHTYDSATTEGVSIIAAPDLGGTPNVFNGLLKNYKTATFNTDGSVKYNRYTGTTFTVVDSSSYKPLVIDANGNMREAYWFSTPSTNIYNSDGTQTDATRTYNASEGNLVFDSLGNINFWISQSGYFDVSNTGGSGRLGAVANYSYLISPNGLTSIDVYNDTINLGLSTTSSKLLIPNLNTGASTDSVMVWNSSTKRVAYRNASSFGTTYTASNGLTLSGSDFRLGSASVSGGEFTADRYINQDAYTLYINSSNANQSVYVSNSNINAAALIATNTAGGSGLIGSSSSGTGIQGSTSGGTAILASANTGTAIRASTVGAGGLPLELTNQTSSTNTVLPIQRLYRTTDATAATGIGGSIDFYLETSDASFNLSNQLISKLTNVTPGTRTSQFIITGVNSGTTGDIISFEGNKRTMLYGRLEMQQGADVASVAGAIAVGTDGNVFELTGTNAVTLISNLNWVNGSEITFVFTSTATLTDGTANSGTDIGMELAGNANFTGSADDVITLVLTEVGGVQRWREKNRSVN